MDELPVLEMVLGLFGLAFTAWAFYVRGMRNSLDRTVDIIQKMVDVKLDAITSGFTAIEKDVHEIRGDMKDALSHMTRHEVRLSVLEAAAQQQNHKE